MVSHAELRSGLGDAVRGGEPALVRADRLCNACVRLLDVDGAAMTLMISGSSGGTFGSGGELGSRLGEFQFTFGEGPCTDAMRTDTPVLVPDLEGHGERRWPAYAGSVLAMGVRAVYALPVRVANVAVGALDLYRYAPGALVGDSLVGALMAAELAALPLLDIIANRHDLGATGDDTRGWEELAALAQVEIYQATGMVMAQLGVGPAEALVRVRAHAFAHNLTASEVAWAIVERRLSLESDT